jgi:UDP-2-acetamido-2-deoxy-ribo-hexuluronate aminotransferase
VANPIIPYMDIPSRLSKTQAVIDTKVQEVLHSGQFIGGEILHKCETEVSTIMGFSHGVGVGSGTDALRMALQAIGVQANDEVIIPAVSFIATYESIVQLGATPIVVDVRADQPLICNRKIESAITEKTKAIVPVHLFGEFAAVEDFGIPIVDDAAQAFGAVSSHHGFIAALSFYPTKIIGGAGDGGMVLCSNQTLSNEVRALGSHGVNSSGTPKRVKGHVSGNSRLDAIQAAVILAQLPDINRRIHVRKQIATRYNSVLGKYAFKRDLSSNVSVYSFRHPRRDQIRKKLRSLGIHTAIYYPTPISKNPVLNQQFECPNAEMFCSEVLSLPCHVGLSENEIEYICSSLHSIIYE